MKETENFKKTLKQLELFLSKPIEDDRDRAGIIQAFEFTFEQAWKAVQKLAGKQGVTVASPKSAFQFALNTGWIRVDDEQKWLDMIIDRNLTSHTYQESHAKEVVERISLIYVKMFQTLLVAADKSA